MKDPSIWRTLVKQKNLNENFNDLRILTGPPFNTREIGACLLSVQKEYVLLRYS